MGFRHTLARVAQARPRPGTSSRVAVAGTALRAFSSLVSRLRVHIWWFWGERQLAWRPLGAGHTERASAGREQGNYVLAQASQQGGCTVCPGGPLCHDGGWADVHIWRKYGKEAAQRPLFSGHAGKFNRRRAHDPTKEKCPPEYCAKALQSRNSPLRRIMSIDSIMCVRTRQAMVWREETMKGSVPAPRAGHSMTLLPAETYAEALSPLPDLSAVAIVCCLASAVLRSRRQTPGAGLEPTAAALRGR